MRSGIIVDAACPLVHPGRGEEAFGQYLDQMLQGGVSMALGTVASIESFEERLQLLYAYYPLFGKFRDRVLHAKSMEDVHRAKAEGKVAILFHFQGSGMLDYDLGRLALFKELGVGVIQLAYNWKFLVGDGCTERREFLLDATAGPRESAPGKRARDRGTPSARRRCPWSPSQ